MNAEYDRFTSPMRLRTRENSSLGILFEQRAPVRQLNHKYRQSLLKMSGPETQCSESSGETACTARDPRPTSTQQYINPTNTHRPHDVHACPTARTKATQCNGHFLLIKSSAEQ